MDSILKIILSSLNSDGISRVRTGTQTVHIKRMYKRLRGLSNAGGLAGCYAAGSAARSMK